MRRKNKLFYAWVDIVIAIGDGENYASLIAKKRNFTYTHVVKQCKLLKEKGIVKMEMKGRTNCISLTKTGEEVFNSLLMVKNVLSR